MNLTWSEGHCLGQVPGVSTSPTLTVTPTAIAVWSFPSVHVIEEGPPADDTLRSGVWRGALNPPHLAGPDSEVLLQPQHRSHWPRVALDFIPILT